MLYLAFNVLKLYNLGKPTRNRTDYLFIKDTMCACVLELITFEILAAERLRLMEFDNRLIIDCFANVVNILIWQFSTNDRFKSEKYESITWKIHFQK